jgi:DNA-binding transcriptional ArsR family regulator
VSDIPGVYHLESIEQAKAIADELRQRIIHALARQAMTVTQLGDLLGQPPAKLHYHVRELERLGLVVLVETREKGGILEKYYRARGRTLAVPSRLFQEEPGDETIAAVLDFLENVVQGFTRSFSRAASGQASRSVDTVLSRWHLWLTMDDMAALNEDIARLVERYERPRGLDGERELSFVQMVYDPRAEPSAEAGEGTSLERFTTPGHGARVNLERGKHLRTWTAGVTSYGRRDLERVVDRDRALDIVSLGRVTFRDDVTPDLADQAIYRFRHRGLLSAPPEVREVLMRKGDRSDPVK